MTTRRRRQRGRWRRMGRRQWVAAALHCDDEAVQDDEDGVGKEPAEDDSVDDSAELAVAAARIAPLAKTAGG